MASPEQRRGPHCEVRSTCNATARIYVRHRTCDRTGPDRTGPRDVQLLGAHCPQLTGRNATSFPRSFYPARSPLSTDRHAVIAAWQATAERRQNAPQRSAVDLRRRHRRDLFPVDRSTVLSMYTSVDVVNPYCMGSGCTYVCIRVCV